MLHALTAAALAIVVAITAYLPGNCATRSAADDLAQADLVAIGRVVAVQQTLERVKVLTIDRREIETTYVGYHAVIRLGRVVRGAKQVGDEIHLHLGGYERLPGEDDTTPTRLRTHNTHARIDLVPDGVYLLCLNGDARTDAAAKAANGTWYGLRSCHFSIHDIVAMPGGAKRLAVRESVGWEHGDDRVRTLAEPIALEAFLAGKRAEPPADR